MIPSSELIISLTSSKLLPLNIFLNILSKNSDLRLLYDFPSESIPIPIPFSSFPTSSPGFFKVNSGCSLIISSNISTFFVSSFNDENTTNLSALSSSSYLG